MSQVTQAHADELVRGAAALGVELDEAGRQGLLAYLALLFLIDYAAMRDRVREVALPLKILHPGVATSSPETGTAATARDTDMAPAATARRHSV